MLGEYIRQQRHLANLSLRKLAEMTNVSTAYLSQIERGLYHPSAQVLRAIAGALEISATRLYAQAGLLDEPTAELSDVEGAIRADQRLSVEDKEMLLRLYRTVAGGSFASRPQRPPGRAAAAS